MTRILNLHAGSLLAIAVAAAVPATAMAQELPTGSRLVGPKQSGPTLTAEDQADGARKVARCIYNRHREAARAFILAPTKAQADASASRLNGENNCWSLVFANELVQERRVSMPDDIFRGMIAEAALTEAKNKVTALPALPLEQRAYTRSWFASTGRHSTVDEMGACIADTNPRAIQALINTVPMSKKEGVALGDLGDSLRACLQVGTKLQASRGALRAALADALYHRLMLPPEPPAPVQTASEKR